MRTYLIGYDLDRPGQNYHCITAKLKGLGAWRILDSTALVSSTWSAVQLRDHLAPCLDANDKLMVVRVHNDAAWRGFDPNSNNALMDVLKAA